MRRSVLASMSRTTASASSNRPLEISQRGDSGKRAISSAIRSPGTAPIQNMIFQPMSGTSHAPICPVAIKPTGKISSYSRKYLPRP